MPFRSRELLADAVQIPQDRIVVHLIPIGGDFGGKGSLMDLPLCYHLARHTGRPVKMVMEYREEFFAGAPRHAAIMKLKTGVTRDGTIVAHQMDAYLDAGAYGGFRPGAIVVLHQGRDYSLRVLERVIAKAKEEGYSFVIPEDRDLRV